MKREQLSGWIVLLDCCSFVHLGIVDQQPSIRFEFVLQCSIFNLSIFPSLALISASNI